MLSLRLIDNELDELHPMLARWWEGHGWPVVPLVALRTMALLAEEDGRPLAAGFVYTASTGYFAMLEWLVTDPDLKPLQAVRALYALIEFAGEEINRRGYNALLSTCRQPALGRLFERHGFVRTDQNVSHYLRVY